MNKTSLELKRLIKKLTPEEIEKRNLAISLRCREMEIEQYTPKEEDWWRYIYIMKCGEYHKIGIATNVKHRLNSIQCGNPYLVTLVSSYRHKHAEIIEKELHSIFKHKHHLLEWFNLTEEDLIFIKEFITNYETKT